MTITLPRRFTFDWHREFRQTYFDGQPPQPEYAVDFSQTEFVDSAALGMLLQLREHAGNHRQNVRLTGAKGDIRMLLEAAGFAQLFRLE